MKCQRTNDLEISEKVMEKYDLESVEGKIKYILEEKDGFFPLFPNEFFHAMGGEVEKNKVKKIMFKDIDNMLEILNTKDLNIKNLNIKNIDITGLSKAKVYSLDGIFTSLISFLDMTKVFKAMRKDKEKLEKVFDIIEENYIEFIKIINQNGVKYFSYADPSAMKEILGKHYEKWILERFIKFLERLLDTNLDIVIHICPTLFYSLKENLIFEKKIVKNYQNEFLEENKYRIVGGSCIKNKSVGEYFYFL